MAVAQPSTSLLERLEELINIDADTLDYDFIQSLPIIPHDQTSNPFWLHMQMSDPKNAGVVKKVARELQDEGFLAVYTRLAVLFSSQNLTAISGRVLVQTLPSTANDVNATVEHARAYVAEFARAGVPRDRYCIKIMATGAGVNAAEVLSGEGIPTLGTGIFSVEQAVACSQAGCLFISPYYNDVADPAIEHPFSNRLLQMVKAFKDMHTKTGRRQPLIKNAAFRSWQEVVASAEIGCHSATISIQTLKELAETPACDVTLPALRKVAALENPYAADSHIPPSRLRSLLEGDPLAQAESWTPCNLDIDYLSDLGKELEKALNADDAARRRFGDALGWFLQTEAESRNLIQGFWAETHL
ncbi:putative transaldolase [Microdochium trichocladiopsis]|uniref:Transaldolase n=1 Tax=Microdochium trichocladiopsis TaxID=1682393 RepID=A0A9P8YB19_9PEZI|nr:putative transaldolase [Microdochium trichocladiopsis]KAH7034675.1 putative transaldolase [Microdochium trichocladiopsis]